MASIYLLGFKIWNRMHQPHDIENPHFPKSNKIDQQDWIAECILCTCLTRSLRM